MILIYSHKITPRLTYIFKHIFVRILQIEISFTSDISEFVSFSGPKLTYAKQALGKEFFIRSHDLLFQQGIQDVEISMNSWEEVPCFFPSMNSSIPFDIFAAGFYLLSRYEEYFPHKEDQYERFPASESLAYKSGFLEFPVIDIWAYKFLKVLKERYPDFEVIEREFEYISTFDIDIAFDYKHKGIIRTLGGTSRDILSLRIGKMIQRYLSIFGLLKDPFDAFDRIIQIQNRYEIKTLFFFQIGDYTTYDKNISATNTKFRSLIKSVSDYADVGLHPSYFTMRNSEKLKKEKTRLEKILNRPIYQSRQHFLRLDLPETYQNLIDLEVLEDYTMGYPSHVGFRASTCTPFYFYDLDYEIQTPLKVYPFAVMDATLRDYLKLKPKEAFRKMVAIKNEVQKVNGTLITLFHNEIFSKNERWKDWENIYEGFVKEMTLKNDKKIQ
ncbi:polysaccharide deacetylase family protein [Aureivirga sp. CE67]|uniref:polysaccharide deacetylase family protein n=1 Tax=Aureivirga sp. CE67 TaxID=1788983 RepID=UPI0018CAA286|nr:polysaccharide deacetylase family protein [Aureivirga sp. CE67]